MTEEARPPSRDNLGVPEAAWLRHEVAHSVAEEVPHRDDAIAVFVDGARWLPDNVVGCVARAMLMDGSGGVLQESAAVCEPLADVYSPKFSLRLQLTGKQPANATLAVSLRGIETELTSRVADPDEENVFGVPKPPSMLGEAARQTIALDATRERDKTTDGAEMI